jgi:hypothetical protein
MEDQKMKTTKFLSVCVAIVATVLVSCKKESEVAPNPGNASSGRSSFNVKMTDAPGDYAALNVQIAKVEVFGAESGWITLSNSIHNVNVIDLTNGAETMLAANAAVDAGLYTKLKITFGEQYALKLNAGAEYGGVSLSTATDVKLSWVGPKEVILVINKQMEASASADLLIDFEVTESVTKFGDEYVITPVMEIIDDAKTGLRGQVSAAAHAAVEVSNGANHFSTYADANGNFLVRDLLEGPATVTILPTPEEIKKGLPKEFKIENVIVSKGQIKNMGTIHF